MCITWRSMARTPSHCPAPCCTTAKSMVPAKPGLKDDVRINKAGCFSQCGHGPMMVVYPDNVWYCGVQESDLRDIFESHIVAGKPVARLQYAPGVGGANKKKGAK